MKISNWKSEKNHKEDVRKKTTMKERDKLQKWDPSWVRQTRVKFWETQVWW